MSMTLKDNGKNQPVAPVRGVWSDDQLGLRKEWLERFGWPHAETKEYVAALEARSAPYTDLVKMLQVFGDYDWIPADDFEERHGVWTLSLMEDAARRLLSEIGEFNDSRPAG